LIQPVWAEKRVALVIGNGAYPKVGNLANPPNDAALMASTLRDLGFDVIERINANQKIMKRAIKAFGKKLEQAGEDAVGLTFFAGHGVQVKGVNYMIPVNAEIEDESDVDIEAVSANAVQSEMEFAGNRLNIIIMDACRNNPFKRGFRSTSRGLARMDASKGTLIAYATSPGDVAADGVGSGNSPYTQALAKAMRTPGLTVERVFKTVRNSVVAATNSKQVPWEASSLVGDDFYFRAPLARLPGPSAEDLAQKATESWNNISDKGDLNSLLNFIGAHPGSPEANMAREQVRKLTKRSKSPAPVASIAPIRPSNLGRLPVKADFYGEWAADCNSTKFARRLVIRPTSLKFFDGLNVASEWSLDGFSMETNDAHLVQSQFFGSDLKAWLRMNDDLTMNVISHSSLNTDHKCATEHEIAINSRCGDNQAFYKRFFDKGQKLKRCRAIQAEINR